MNEIGTLQILRITSISRDEAEIDGAELSECACCGRKIRAQHHMSNGDVLGSECAYWFQGNGYRAGRPATRAFSRYAERRNLFGAGRS